MLKIECKNFRIQITNPTIANQLHEIEFTHKNNNHEYIYAINKKTSQKFIAKRNKEGIYHLQYEYHNMFPSYIVADLNVNDYVSQIKIKTY